MKTKSCVFLAAALAVASTATSARADIPACSGNTTTDCLLDNVLVVNGAATINNAVLVPTCNYIEFKTGLLAGKRLTACTPMGTGNYGVYYPNLQAYVVQLLKKYNVTTQWDNVVFLNADFTTGNSTGVAFYRLGATGAATTGPTGVNFVQNIGLPYNPQYSASAPWVGYVTMGSTTDFGTYQSPPSDPPSGSRFYGKGWPEADPAGVPGVSSTYPNCSAASQCYSDYNGYQALAQSTGALYGPYIQVDSMNDDGFYADDTITCIKVWPPGAGGSNDGGADGGAGTTAAATLAPGDVPVDGIPKKCFHLSTPPDTSGKGNLVMNPLVKPRIWNSFIDMDYSLFGGVNFRETGARTATTTGPVANWIASPPYQGDMMVHFNPLELYTMGFVPTKWAKNYADPSAKSIPPSIPNYAVYNFNPSQNYGVDFVGTGTPGPAMGPQSDGNFYFSSYEQIGSQPVSIDLITAQNGARMPAFEDANNNHSIRQLWVLVTKPNLPKEDPNASEGLGPQTQRIANLVTKWRRDWGHYFYMLTNYTGRVVTTVSQDHDDVADWEFGQPFDDQMTFKSTGTIDYNLPGPIYSDDGSVYDPTQVHTGSPVISTPLRVNSSGSNGGVVLQNRIPVKISTSQDLHGPTNAAVVRMRVPPGTASDAHAILQLNDSINIQLPSADGSYLVADGQWHTYSALLSTNNDFTNAGTITKFAIIPSDKGFDKANTNGQTLDIEFVRLQNVDATDALDSDSDCSGAAKPDGWIDAFDNCPKLYNPDQADQDQNGIGDACEDYDFDGVVNACDNCPTLANVRQEDRNHNGIGDVCDTGQDAGCFLAPNSLGGRVKGGGSLALILGAFGVTGLVVLRRTRRRR